MAFTRWILGVISWLRHHKIQVILMVIGLEALIGLADFLFSNEIPVPALHYITIGLITILYGWRGAVGLSVLATVSYYVANYGLLGQPSWNHARYLLPSITSTFLIFLVVSAGVVLILNLLTSLEASNRTLSEKLAQLEASRAQIELLTSERERLRLARELHDGVAKTLLGVEYNAAALAQMIPPHNTMALDKAHFIEKVCHDEAQQLREVILDLRQGYKEPLFDLIAEYLQRWQRAYNFEVTYTHQGSDQNLAPALLYELMSILEEALENIQRHSGAKRVGVNLVINGSLVMSITDNGGGLSQEMWQKFKAVENPDRGPNHTSLIIPSFRTDDGRPHFGLTGMSERAEWLGGQLNLESLPRGGLKVEVVIPLTSQTLKVRPAELSV